MNLSAIYILWFRQLKRYSRSRARIIGSLAQPLLYLLAMGFGFGPIFQKAGAGNYIQFLVPGITAMSVMTTSLFTGIEIIWDKQFGFLKETLVAPVSRLDIMLGRTLGGATVATIQGLIVILISLLVGFKPFSFSMLPVAVLFMFLTALLFTGLGTAVASRLEDMQGFQLIMNFLIMPLFFLSGALFPLQGLPRILTTIAGFNPLSYGVDGLRMALVNTTAFGMGLDMAVLIGVVACFLFLGSYLFSKIQI